MRKQDVLEFVLRVKKEIINNTVVAPPRMLIAFLENHYQADGSITIPEVLRPYMGGIEVLKPNKK